MTRIFRKSVIAVTDSHLFVVAESGLLNNSPEECHTCKSPWNAMVKC